VTSRGGGEREKRREGETGRRRRGALPLPNRPFAVNGFTYDAAGNLTNDGGQSFSYDATGQQATASYSGYILQQTYDGERLRVKKVENGATTYYLRSTVLGGQIVAELNSAGSWTRGFVYLGGQLLAVQQNSWVHQDPFVKSKRVTDSAGTVVSVIELDPWGGDTARSNNAAFQPRRFTTYDRDGNASDEAMHRRYNRWHSRFDQPDPYEGSYNLVDPQSFNRYSYVQNDPVNFVDPSGLNHDTLGPPPPVPTLVPPSGPLDVITTNTWAPRFGGGSILGSNNHFVPEQGPEQDPPDGGGPQNPGLPPARPPIDPSNNPLPPLPFCGVNPLTGTPGFTRAPVGTTGHLRAPQGGRGEWHAPRGRRVHQGLDIAGVLNQTTVVATLDGTIEAAGWGGADAGVRVRINHGNGLVTRYAHLQTGSIPPWLTPGATVNKGEFIGTVGNTGNAGNTPPHLHFNVSVNGQNQNPETFLNSPCP